MCKVVGDKVKATSWAKLSDVGLSGNVEGSKLVGGSHEETANATSKAPDKKEKKASHGFSMQEARHTRRGDVQVVLHGRVLNVSNFLSQHPREVAILTFAATAEFDIILPPDANKKYVPHAVNGTPGEGGEDNDKQDDGHVLNVSNFFSLSILAQLAILTFAGKDAVAEFDMTHPRDVVEKYLSDPVIGVVGSGKAEMVRGAAFDDEPGVLLVIVRSHGDACC